MNKTAKVQKYRTSLKRYSDMKQLWLIYLAKAT